MSTERFKSYVALVIEQQTFYKLLVEAEAEGKCCSNLQARYDDMGARAQRVLVDCFTAPSDMRTVYLKMQDECDYEMIRNNASGRERRLAICHHDVAFTCMDLNFSAEDDRQLLREENGAQFRKICEYIREEYLGYR